MFERASRSLYSLHHQTRLCIPAALVLLALLCTTAPMADYPQIRLNSDSSGQLQNEQQICVNPADPDNIVACWRDFRLGYRQVGVGYSLDGGDSWTDYLIGGELPWDSDPVLITDSDGTFYLVVINYENGGANQLSVHRSSNRGITWEGPFSAVYSSGGTFEDKEWIAVDRTGGSRDGNVYIAWARFYEMKIMCVTSTDRAESWSSPAQVSDDTGNSQWPVPIVLANGNVLVAWDVYYPSKIAYDISTDGGNTWGTDRTLTNTGTGPGSEINGDILVFPFPSLVLDETSGPRAGWLYCVYPDRAVSSNGMDIWCRRSTDNGNSWSDAVRVNDDPAGLVRDQFHSWVTCDELGVLTAIWYDRREDSQNYLWHIYMSRSHDGGLTWEPNVRITDVPSSPGDAMLGDSHASTPAGGFVPLEYMRAGLIGEYSGVTAGGGAIYPVWTDTRNGNQDVYVSVLQTPSAVEDPVATSFPLTLQALPNPGRGDVHFQLQTSRATEGSVEVIDSSGRLLRVLRAGPLPAGEVILRWDGRDEMGTEAPAGVYFTRVREAGGCAVQTRCVLIR